MNSPKPLFQTIFLLFLPFLPAKFNSSAVLSAERHHQCTHSHESFNCPTVHLNDTNAEAFFASLDVERLQTVVIDAGHGGHDSGCRGSNIWEKHVALSIALFLAEDLREKYPALNVVLTRDKDVFVPLHERARIANRNNADLFISIHCNYFPPNSSVNGSETYVLGMHRLEENLDVAMRENASILLEEDYESNYDYDPNSPVGHIMLAMYQNAYLDRSIRFAEYIEERMAIDANRRSRGVRQAGFLVLRETAMPSVLIETGFLSNGTEENYLRTTEGQKQVATAILRAFSNYKSELEGTLAEKFDPLPALPLQVEVSTPVQPPPREIPQPIMTPQEASVPESTPEATQPIQDRTPVVDPVESFLEPQLNIPVPEVAPEVIQFRVQLAASPRPLNIDGPAWELIPYQVQVLEEDGFFKYQARPFSKFEEADAARSFLKEQGFPDAFIVAYQGIERIRVQEAIRILSAKKDRP